MAGAYAWLPNEASLMMFHLDSDILCRSSRRQVMPMSTLRNEPSARIHNISRLSFRHPCRWLDRRKCTNTRISNLRLKRTHYQNRKQLGIECIAVRTTHPRFVRASSRGTIGAAQDQMRFGMNTPCPCHRRPLEHEALVVPRAVRLC